MENLTTGPGPELRRGIGDELLDQFYVEMSELIDALHAEVSEYTPAFYDSYVTLRSSATKIFLNFLGDVKDLMAQVKAMDQNQYVQGRLFDYD